MKHTDKVTFWLAGQGLPREPGWGSSARRTSSSHDRSGVSCFSLPCPRPSAQCAGHPRRERGARQAQATSYLLGAGGGESSQLNLGTPGGSRFRSASWKEPRRSLPPTAEGELPEGQKRFPEPLLQAKPPVSSQSQTLRCGLHKLERGLLCVLLSCAFLQGQVMLIMGQSSLL